MAGGRRIVCVSISALTIDGRVEVDAGVGVNEIGRRLGAGFLLGEADGVNALRDLLEAFSCGLIYGTRAPMGTTVGLVGGAFGRVAL